MIIQKGALPALIPAEEFAALKAMAAESPRRRARILMHGNHQDPMQEMLIAITKDAYIMPHRQTDRVKTYIVMEGKLLLAFFESDGTILSMHELAGDGDRIVRFDTNRWHTVMALSDMCVYLEIAQGPFEGSQWASWAPKDETSQEAMNFMKRLKAWLAKP